MKPLALVAALLAVGLTAVPADAAPDKIAVVDMVKLVEKHPRFTELERKLEQAQQDAQQYAENENKELRKLRSQIELMNRNSPQRRGLEKQLLVQQSMLKLEIEWRQQMAMHEYRKGLEGLYAQIQGLVSRYARENGIQMVLHQGDSELQSVDVNDFGLKLRLRTVVFSEPEFDITDRIMAMFMPRAPQPGNPPPAQPGRSPAPPATPNR